MKNCKGNINSFQSLAALDGEGLRFAVFMQGCPFRCIYCHNPETQDFVQNMQITSEQLIQKVLRYKSYFGDKGGVTVTGGEPLCQGEFIVDFFEACKQNGIKTALDTSGGIIDQYTDTILTLCDELLLDVKFKNNELSKRYTGINLDNTLNFLELADAKGISITIRQVIVTGYNDDDENISFLKSLSAKYKSIKKIKLLPFKKLCIDKYEKLEKDFLLKNHTETTQEHITKLMGGLN